MNCPKCQSDRFEEFHIEGVTVDFCRDCKALWFDNGELAFYSETEKDIPSLHTAAEAAKASDANCPKCVGVNLLEMRYYPGEQLMVDYCTSCDGVLLDEKEVVHLNDIVGRHGLARVGKIMAELHEKGYEILSGT